VRRAVGWPVGRWAVGRQALVRQAVGPGGMTARISGGGRQAA
jgi:hypothetical protein